jgi:hypothetical protein
MIYDTDILTENTYILTFLQAYDLFETTLD